MQYVITEKNGVYTATLPLALKDGRTLRIRCSADIVDTYRELGLDPRIEYLQHQEEVGGFPGSMFKAIGKVVKKITKSKVIRKVVGVAKKVLKNPITTVALGAVTGGSALPALASANVAIRLAEAATKGGKKGKAARKVLKAAKRASNRKKLKLLKARRVRGKLARRGFLNPQNLANLQLRALRRKIQAAKARGRRKGLALLRQRAAAKRRPVSVRPRPRPTTRKKAVDWLVNVHFV